MFFLTVGNNNTSLGRQAGHSITNGGDNTYVGHNAGLFATGNNNSYVGSAAGDAASHTGGNNSALGFASLGKITTGANNSAMGFASADELTTGSRNLALGVGAGSGSSPFQPTTQDNRIILGDNNITNAYIRVSFTVTSDKRDKTNFGDVPYGLDFVNKLKPTSYNNVKDRETKEINGKRKYGFLAQDILQLEGDNPIIIDNEDKNRLSYQESNLIPILVNAIQELKAEIELLKAK